MTDRSIKVYTPESPLRHPAGLFGELRTDLWASRELAWRLFVRDLSAQYRGSALGYLWVFAPPLLTSLPFVYLNAAGVLRTSDTAVPYAVYALVGTTIWQTFVDALNSPIRGAQGSRSMLTRINFPRESILLAGLLQVAFNFLVRAALLLLVYVILGFRPASTAPLFLVGAISVALAGFAVGLLLTPFALLFADVQHVLAILTTGAMLVTPVMYPVPQAGIARIVSAYNPLSVLVSTSRAWLTGDAGTDVPGFILVTGATLAFLLLGWVFYRLALPHLISRLGN
jgi:lipopolysaccharide transport system permease protein